MLRCTNCDKVTWDAEVNMINNMLKILNNYPQIVPYMLRTNNEFQQHQQKNQNNEYKLFPVSFLLDELET